MPTLQRKELDEEEIIMHDNTWEIMYLVDAYNKAFFKSKNSVEQTKTQQVYARALQIVCKDDAGKVMTVEDFEESVREGLLTDFDGVGIFLSWEGERKDLARCDSEWLAANKKDYPFVRWFNK